MGLTVPILQTRNKCREVDFPMATASEPMSVVRVIPTLSTFHAATHGEPSRKQVVILLMAAVR